MGFVMVAIGCRPIFKLPEVRRGDSFCVSSTNFLMSAVMCSIQDRYNVTVITILALVTGVPLNLVE